MADAETTMTREELVALITKYGQENNIAELIKASEQLAKMEKDKAKLELEAKQKAVEELTITVKGQIDKFIEKLKAEGKLDQADGVWFSYDFGDTASTCKLIKGSVSKRTGGGGGGGKKYSESSAELLEKFGNEEYKDGQTYQQAWDSGEGDKNKRFAIRESLLKKAGIAK